jgi:ribosome-associated protein
MEEEVSKSQKKREADFLQKAGVKFIDLSLTKLDALPLSDPLRKAILDAKSIKSHGAKRRQAQLIGKLMRACDYEAILATYEQLIQEDNSATADFHEVELWRDKLIQGGKEELTEFVGAYQPEEVQQLRQLIKKAVDDQQKQKNTGAAKALFRYLRSVIQ